MPDLGGFLDWGGYSGDLVGDFNRAEGIEYMLGYRGVSITILRGTSTLAAQTALIAATEQKTETAGAAGASGRQQFLVVGLRGHATLADLNIKRGDRFAYNGINFEVTHVDKTLPGKVEARVEAMQ